MTELWTTPGSHAFASAAPTFTLQTRQATTIENHLQRIVIPRM
jgi:uncharacterized protein YqcC (DUF446 family)